MRNPLYPLKPLFDYCFSKLGVALGQGLVQTLPTLRWELEKRAVMSTADYVVDKMGDAIVFNSHWELLNYTVHRSMDEGWVMEFGVYKAKTLNYISKLVEKKAPGKVVWGFDSFTGLPSDWTGYYITKETFDLHGVVPTVNSNVRLVRGYFDQSLDGWLNSDGANSKQISLLHIDSDIYDSCVTILGKLRELITVGTFILFDEYFNYPNWKNHEYLAFQEFCSKYDVKYKYLAFYEQKVLVRIENIRLSGK